MANIDNPRGLYPTRNLNGGRIACRAYWKSGTTTAVFQGDLVYLTGSDGRLLPMATTTGSSDTLGVAANYRSAGSSGYTVWVYDDPNTIFGINSDGATSEDHTDHIGAVCVLTAGTGNTTTGLSGYEVDYSSITSTGTATDNAFKIVGMVRDVDNDSASSHADFEVLILDHTYGSRIANSSV